MAKIVPYLTMPNANQAVEFYRENLGAELVSRLNAPDGRLVHGVLRVQDSLLYLADDWHQENGEIPHGTHISLLLEVDDAKQIHDRLVELGATSLHPPKEMFWGACFAQIRDPFGIIWGLNAQTRQPTAEDMETGFQEWLAQFK